MFNGVIYCGNVQIQYGTLWVRVRLWKQIKVILLKTKNLEI